MRTASDALMNRMLAEDPNVTPADRELLLKHPLVNELLLSGLSIRMVVLDLTNGSYIYASPTLEEFHHLERWDEEMQMGWRYIDTLIHPEDSAELGSAVAQFGEYLAQLPDAQQPFCKLVVTYRIRNKTGEYRKLLQQVIPFLVTPQDARVRYMAVVLQDITLIKASNEVSGYLVHRQPDAKDAIVPLRLKPSQLAVGASSTQLSRRERDVLRLLVQGHSSKMIAEELNISAMTVAVHRRNLMRKTASANAAQLTAFALRSGMA